MKITRKGNRKGLDIDFQVDVDTPEDVENLHNSLLEKGLLFTYATGDTAYRYVDSNIVLHYIDDKFRLYDYAIVFTPKERSTAERVRYLDKEYERAQSDPEYKEYFMKYMKYHKLLTAFKKHMRAYGEPLSGEYRLLFDKLILHIHKHIIEIDSIDEYTIDNLKKIDLQLKKVLLPE